MCLSEKAKQDNVLISASFFSWCVSVFFAIYFLVFSVHLNFSVALPILITLFMSSIILLFFPLCLKLFKADGWFGKIFIDQLGTVALFVILAIVGLYLQQPSQVLQMIFVTATMVLVGFAVIAMLRYSKFEKVIIGVVISIAASVVILSIYFNDSTLINPGAFWSILRSSFLDHDRLYYTAITAMIKTYHMPTTGVFNFKYVPNYWGSEAIVAGLSSFFKLNMIDSRSLIISCMVIPLLIKQYLLLNVEVYLLLNKHFNFKYLQAFVLFSLLIFVFMLCPPSYVIAMRIWYFSNFPLFQQTTLVSTVFMLVFGGAVFYILSSIERVGKRVRNVFITIVTLPVLFFFVAICKPSNAIILILLCVYPFFRFKLYRYGSIIIAIVLILMVEVFVYRHFTPHFYTAHVVTSNFDLFGFFHKYIKNDWFYLYEYRFAYIYLIIRVLNKNIFSLRAWKDKSFIDLEFFIVAAIVCNGLASVVLVGGGSSYYFLVPFKYISLILAVCALYQTFFKELVLTVKSKGRADLK